MGLPHPGHTADLKWEPRATCLALNMRARTSSPKWCASTAPLLLPAPSGGWVECVDQFPRLGSTKYIRHCVSQSQEPIQGNIVVISLCWLDEIFLISCHHQRCRLGFHAKLVGIWCENLNWIRMHAIKEHIGFISHFKLYINASFFMAIYNKLAIQSEVFESTRSYGMETGIGLRWRNPGRTLTPPQFNS